MKKILPFISLFVALAFSSCEKQTESFAEELEGLYTYVQTGYGNFDGAIIDVSKEGAFRVTHLGNGALRFSGDLNAVGYMTDGYSFEINSKIDNFSDENGTHYFLEYTYHNGFYSPFEQELSFDVQVPTTLSYDGNVMQGVIIAVVTAYKQ